MRLILTLALSLFLLSKLSCGRGPGEYSGLCTADCSNTLIATNEMQIESLLTDNLELDCSNKSIGEEHATVPISFKVLRPYLEIDPDDPDKEPTSSFVPAPLISFNAALINGTINGDIDDLGTSCTDSCGVGYLRVNPICGAKENNIKLMIQSGPITKVISVKIKGV